MALAVTDDGSEDAVAAAAGDPAADGPTDEITRLRAEIARRRQRLDSALHELEHRVSEDLNWRKRLGAHPWLLIGAATLAGFAFGRIEWTGRGRSRRR